MSHRGYLQAVDFRNISHTCRECNPEIQFLAVSSSPALFSGNALKLYYISPNFCPFVSAEAGRCH